MRSERHHALTAALHGLLLVCSFLAAQSAAAGAQVVHGTVFLPDSARAAGAIVVARRLARGEPSRVLTTSAGEYRIPLPGAGRYEVRVLRIGFRPTVLPEIEIGSGETRELSIVLRDEPILLSTVRIRENSSCVIKPDAGLDVARVWDAAQAAIIMTQLYAGAQPLDAAWVDYDRLVDLSGERVREQRVTTSRGATYHPFESRSAELLASDGYAVDTESGMTFYAPDAAALLSDSFAAAHCLRLVPPPKDQPSLIGVRFEPSSTGASTRDINGTFWLDRSTLQLRSLDFAYTNLPASLRTADASGRVEFLRVADGVWVVRRWSIRTPKLGMQSALVATAATIKNPGSRLVPIAEHITGGEVTRVARGDSVLYASGRVLHVQLVSRDSLVPAPGARLTLDGTDYTGTADSLGRVTLSPVLDGRYVARVTSAFLDSLGFAPTEHLLEAVDAARVDSIALPSARDVLRKVCPSDSIQHGEALVRGTVRDVRGHPVKWVAVTVTWQDAFLQDANSLSWNERTIGALTDDAGQWQLCGVPRGRKLAVRALGDSIFTDTTVRIGLHDFATADLTVRAGTDSRAHGSGLARALVEIAVYDTLGRPLPGVAVDVRDADGQIRTVSTGSAGRALVPNVRPGRLRLQVRHIGFRAGDLAVSVEPGRNTVPVIMHPTARPTLDTVRVLGDRRAPTIYDDFDTRYLRREATASLNETDIAKRGALQTWQLFETLPSVKVQFGQFKDNVRQAVYPESARSTTTARGSLTLKPCYMAVMLNGVVMTPEVSEPAFDLRMLPPPGEIYGVEVYGGAASIPLRYAGAVMQGGNCGLIAVWAK
jgi:hypothetical protein